MRTFLGVFLLSAVIAVCYSNTVSTTEWEAYKGQYGKQYTTTAENNARYYYAVNKDRINTHNTRQANGLESYTLAPNQYSDLRFLEFAAMFPPTTEILTNGKPFTVPTTAPLSSFSYASLGFTSTVQDQKQVCNSGWAHAAATAIGIYHAANIVGVPGVVSLSPQNFIDCAGGSKACTNQVSQIAFDYLTLFGQKVFPLSDYKYTLDFGQGMCILPLNQLNGIGLTAYSNVPNGNDVVLMSIVNYLAPVVIKFNPGSFEFMHYKAGIFTQPTPTQTAAHYMTVTGFGTDTVTGKSFWIVQNSFGLSWGESGIIRIERNPVKPIANSAIFPSQ